MTPSKTRGRGAKRAGPSVRSRTEKRSSRSLQTDQIVRLPSEVRTIENGVTADETKNTQPRQRRRDPVGAQASSPAAPAMRRSRSQAPSTGEQRGHFDGYSATEILGWAWNPSLP